MTSATGAKGKKKALEAIAAKDKLLNSHLTPDCFERQSVFKTSFGQLICRLPSAAILLLFSVLQDQMIFVTTNMMTKDMEKPSLLQMLLFPPSHT